MPDHSDQQQNSETSSPEKSMRHDFTVPIAGTIARFFLVPLSLFVFDLFSIRDMPWELSSGRQARWFEHPMIVGWAIMIALPFALFGLVRFTKTLRIEITKRSMQIVERTLLRRRAITFPLAEKPAVQFHRQGKGYWCIEICLQKPFRFGHGFGRKLYNIFGIIETALGRDPATALAAI